jgi:hypothetical protein
MKNLIDGTPAPCFEAGQINLQNQAVETKGRLPGPSLLNNPALRRPARRELQQPDCVIALHAPPTRL